ncbi:DUF3786 domain-containing protein [Breznakiellaceae bacterium SP9]
MKNGYEETYRVILPRLKDVCFPEAAERLGFRIKGTDSMMSCFLGRHYAIEAGGVRVLDGKPVHVNNLSVLVYYAISKGQTAPRYDFALLHAFTGGLFSRGGTAESNWMSAPIRTICAGSDGLEKFRTAARGLGMSYEGSRVSGEHTWQYLLLPKIPVRVKYFEADDEYSCDVKVYYDKTVLEYLDFEPLAVLNKCFISALAAHTKRQA